MSIKILSQLVMEMGSKDIIKKIAKTAAEIAIRGPLNYLIGHSFDSKQIDGIYQAIVPPVMKMDELNEERSYITMKINFDDKSGFGNLLFALRAFFDMAYQPQKIVELLINSEVFYKKRGLERLLKSYGEVSKEKINVSFEIEKKSQLLKKYLEQYEIIKNLASLMASADGLSTKAGDYEKLIREKIKEGEVNGISSSIEDLAEDVGGDYRTYVKIIRNLLSNFTYIELEQIYQP